MCLRVHPNMCILTALSSSVVAAQSAVRSVLDQPIAVSNANPLTMFLTIFIIWHAASLVHQATWASTTNASNVLIRVASAATNSTTAQPVDLATSWSAMPVFLPVQMGSMPMCRASNVNCVVLAVLPVYHLALQTA